MPRQGRWLVLPAIGLLVLSALPARAQEREHLRDGASLVHEIRGGEFQVFEIELSEGDSLQISADQTEADLSLTVYPPGSAAPEEIDEDILGSDPEKAHIVAEKAGLACVEVASGDNAAPRRRFELSVAIRPASNEDRIRSAAFQALEDARAQQNVRTAESSRLVIRDAAVAAALFEEARDEAWEGRTRSFLGAIYSDVDDRVAATKELERGRSLTHLAGDRYGEALADNYLGVFYHRDGDLGKAQQYYEQSLDIMKGTGSVFWDCQVSCNLGWISLGIGQEEKAQRYFEDAFHAVSGVGDNDWYTGVPLMGLGATYRSRGQYRRAADSLRQAINVFHKNDDRRSEAYALGYLGQVYVDEGDTLRAMDAFLGVWSLCRLVGDRYREAVALADVGKALQLLGDAHALEFFEDGLATARQTSIRRSQALASTGLGAALALRGDENSAARYLEDAISLSVELGDPQLEIRPRVELARIARDRGDLACAREDLETAIALEDRLRRRATGYEVRARLSESARGAYDLYSDVLMRMHARAPAAGYDALAFEASEQSRARTLLEVMEESVAGVREGVDPKLLEREEALKILLSGRLERQVRSRTRSTKAPEFSQLDKEIEEIDGELDRIDSEIRSSSPRYAALTRPQAASLEEIRHEALDDDTVLIEYDLGEESSFAWVVTRHSFMSFGLPKRAEIESLAREAYEDILAAREAAAAKTAPGSGRRSDLEAPRRKRLAALARQLFGPVTQLRQARRVLIVADGALQYLPFAELPISIGGSKTEPLVARHEVVSVPSASVLVLARQEGRHRLEPPKLVAVLADPVFEKDDPRVRGSNVAALSRGETAETLNESAFRSAAMVGLGGQGEIRIPRLPYSRRESQAILALSPSGLSRSAFDFDARRAAAMDRGLAQYRFIHFATHGFVNASRPDLSGILLSLVDRNGRAIPGYLSVADIFNLRLPVDLVVLSGCQTALGKEIKGEGLVGLTRGFMYAGARAVLATLWKVDDAATSEFMKSFYSAMLGKEHLSPAAALRQAQLEMRGSQLWSDPVYWSGFVLQGDWKAGELASAQSTVR